MLCSPCSCSWRHWRRSNRCGNSPPTITRGPNDSWPPTRRRWSAAPWARRPGSRTADSGIERRDRTAAPSSCSSIPATPRAGGVRPRETRRGARVGDERDSRRDETAVPDVQSLERRPRNHRHGRQPPVDMQHRGIHLQSGRTGRPPGASRRQMTQSRRRTADAAYIRDFNLWVKDLTGQDRALTTDGIKDFGYATNNAGWIKSDTPVLLWSPDSKKIATFQHDGRGVSDMYLVSTTVGAPRLEAWKYPLPRGQGDLSHPPRRHRRRTGARRPAADAAGSASLDDQRSRGRRQPIPRRRVVSGRLAPGVRVVIARSQASHHSSRASRHRRSAHGAARRRRRRSSNQVSRPSAKPNWRILPSTREVLWWSQSGDWGHLYSLRSRDRRAEAAGHHRQLERRRASCASTKRRARSTSRASDVSRAAIRISSISTACIWTSRRSRCSRPRTPITASRCRRRVTRSSTPTRRRHAAGQRAARDERTSAGRARARRHLEADRGGLEAADAHRRQGARRQDRSLRPDVHADEPRPVAKVSDRQLHLSGPWGSSVGTRFFVAARGDHQALAELGFVVVAIDGMGTEWRSKSFADFYYGNMGDNTIPDQIAGMRELAKRTRTSTSIAPASGAIRAADSRRRRRCSGIPTSSRSAFRKPAITTTATTRTTGASGSRDCCKRSGGKGDNYDSQANQLVAANLKGKLLLAHGAMDDNVPPYNTYLVVDALVKANKDFDLIIFPHARHGFGADNNYMIAAAVGLLREAPARRRTAARVSRSNKGTEVFSTDPARSGTEVARNCQRPPSPIEPDLWKKPPSPSSDYQLNRIENCPSRPPGSKLLPISVGLVHLEDPGPPPGWPPG